MFGLLKHRPQQPDHRADFRKSYCGTCKAIGHLYGHKERLLLNYDVVFLSELLAELNGNSKDFDAISVGRCFSLPKHRQEIPDFLAYTASANLLLASIKINDNIQDSGYKAIGWRALARMQKSRFAKAKKHLEQCGLKMPLVQAHVDEQLRREREREQLPSIAATCSYYAEMTGSLSGEIFRQAAKTAGKPAAAEDLFQIGKAYGEIVYLADALNDYEKDLKKGAFNPLLTGKEKPAATLPARAADTVHELIAANTLVIRRHLFQLPISGEKKAVFAQRLETSINAALYPSHSCAATACHKPGISLYEKYRMAHTRARMAFAPAPQRSLRTAGIAVAASLFALVLLALPLRLDASAPAPSEPTTCWEDLGNSCCQCCCDAICDSICNSGKQ